jgi:hypothetical protein
MMESGRQTSINPVNPQRRSNLLVSDTAMSIEDYIDV